VNRLVVVVVALGVLAAGCGDASSEDVLADIDIDAVLADIENTASGSGSCTWEDAQPALRTWNRAAGELVADYLDLSVSAEAYVQTSRRTMPILDQVVLDLQETRDCMAPFDQNLFAPFVSGYNRKASAMQALEFAVDSSLLAAEEDALAMLDAANLATNEAICDLVAEAPEEFAQQLPILSC
jgi:hypothetical protein